MRAIKNILRKEIKKRINALSAEERVGLSQEVLSRLENNPQFQSAQTILMFWSLPDEIHTHQFIEQWSKKKKILLPVVIDDILEIREFRGMDSMQKGAFGILEPTGEKWKDYSAIDLCVIPGVGFDSAGNRLGRGKGYYDKLLPSIPSYKIGICLPCQLVEKVPTEKWDTVMDKVISLNEG